MSFSNIERRKNRRNRSNPIFFTKSGDLDIGWLILIVCCLIGLFVFLYEALLQKGPSIAAWSWFGAFTSMAFIAGAARDRARLIAKSDAPGLVAQGIAQAQASLATLPSKFDDERDEDNTPQ